MNDKDSPARPSKEDSIYEPMDAIGADLRDIVKRLRFIRDNGRPEAIAYYGGPGYARHLSLAITEIEAGILWLGDYIEGRA